MIPTSDLREPSVIPKPTPTSTPTPSPTPTLIPAPTESQTLETDIAIADARVGGKDAAPEEVARRARVVIEKVSKDDL